MTRPRTIADIPTPAHLVDVPAMERNIRRMAEFFADGPCRLRPHFKAHKTPEAARRRLAAGNISRTCTGRTANYKLRFVQPSDATRPITLNGTLA